MPGGDATCPGSHGEPGVGAGWELPGRELGQPPFTGFPQGHSLFSPDMQIHPPSPTTARCDAFKMFSCPASGASFPSRAPSLAWGTCRFPRTPRSTHPGRVTVRVGKALWPLPGPHLLPSGQASSTPCTASSTVATGTRKQPRRKAPCCFRGAKQDVVCTCSGGV